MLALTLDHQFATIAKPHQELNFNELVLGCVELLELREIVVRSQMAAFVVSFLLNIKSLVLGIQSQFAEANKNDGQCDRSFQVPRVQALQISTKLRQSAADHLNARDGVCKKCERRSLCKNFLRLESRCAYRELIAVVQVPCCLPITVLGRIYLSTGEFSGSQQRCVRVTFESPIG